MAENRTILHCDLNGFFASVETLSHSEIRGKLMVVSGNPRNRHGIILAKNEAAKKYDITTGEPVVKAQRKFPHLILLEAHHEKYELYSAKVNSIYARFTNRVEPFGIDESWLDVSASHKLFGDGKTIADTLRETVKRELGLTISVGVSYNKVFAKLGSDYKKPDATTIFDRIAYEKIIRKMNAASLLFVGRSTAESLAVLGIRTIGQLADAPDKIIARRLGAHGLQLLRYARGLDDSPVGFIGDKEGGKSIGNSITFRRDLLGLDDIHAGLEHVAEKVSQRLKTADTKCAVLHIDIKGADFSRLTRQSTLDRPTNSVKSIADKSLKMLLEAWDLERPIRLLGISGSKLCKASAPSQSKLFDLYSRADSKSPSRKRKDDAAEDAFFKVREKFGNGAIKFGNLIDDDLK